MSQSSSKGPMLWLGLGRDFAAKAQNLIQAIGLKIEMATIALATLTGYLLGSIPFVHILAKMRGVDLRRVGTGNVGGGNLLQASGARIGSLGLMLDLGRGMFPPLLAQSLGLSIWMVAGAATGAVAGQMWPIFRGFRGGGRGNMTALGALLVLSPLATAIALVPVFVGVAVNIRNARNQSSQASVLGTRNSRSVPLGSLFGSITVPLAALALSQGTAVIVAAFAILLLILIRRTTAPWTGTGAEQHSRGIFFRLLYDRPRR